MSKKVLLISTSSEYMGEHPTGLWLEELSIPYKIFKKAGFDVEIASTKGGEVPLDKNSIPHGIPEEDESIAKMLKNTKSLKDIKDESFDAILFAGGHGPLQDFVGNKEVQALVLDTYKKGYIVAGVCHGVTAFVEIKEDGKYFVEGKELTSFTNSEEEIAKLSNLVPFALESKLKEQGAKYHKGEDFESNVVVDKNLITGQNPQSSELIANKIVEELKK